MPRSIIVGDVHGCVEEVARLLDLVGYQTGDALYFTGDLLSRGPDPQGFLELFRSTGARGVRGNHDEVLLQWRAAMQGAHDIPRLSRSNQKLVENLSPLDWQLLESLPIWLDLPDHDLRVVHAGVIPGVPMSDQPVDAVLSMRYLGPHNEPIEKEGTVLWGTRYVGPPHIVFGHNAQKEPQIHPWATGIDTGAVYGERLTAMVLPEGERVPAPAERREVLFSVPSRVRYHGS